MYKQFIRPILFLFDPEAVHRFSFFFLRFVSRVPFVSTIIRKKYQLKDKRLERHLFGLTFKNPVGLAAGFDKNASLHKELSNFGFGFIEIGTVTPKAQGGNLRKRLFRLKKDKGIINRMGLNNSGVEAIIKNLRQRNKNIIIGGNIGKNTATSLENYTQDYATVFEKLHPYVDYFVLNVSCPNVESDAKLNDKTYLLELITTVQKLNYKVPKQKPILLKIAPDLNKTQLDEIIELVVATKIDGVIATNTSVSRAGLQVSQTELGKIGKGGLSGQPITKRSTEVIRYLSQKSNKAFPIIGVGGILSEADALEKLKAGADLLQIYTGFIYQGPSLIKKINNAILKDRE